ncbi:hypothetical protein FOFC_08106 [Fusarium oxysporum]|nr:hypothetical protein FOFC_17319 [Fusarium oxysporum]KAI8411062.1 hypothetical protein FOFC_07656 [Fusarium oxysporum]KAI8411512.1 hypothetical protein FOFC_08106 [Fusarium oxysporum]
MSSLRRARDRSSSSNASTKNKCHRCRQHRRRKQPTLSSIGCSHSTRSP